MKNLSEQIAERVLKSELAGSARNRATFILMRDEISQAIEQGHSILAIWQILRDEGQIFFGYQAFRRYTNQLIKANNVKI